MDLIQNQAILISSDEMEGIYRVIAVAPGLGQIALVKIHTSSGVTPQKPSPLISCRLIWVDQELLRELPDHELRLIEIEPEATLLELAIPVDEIASRKYDRDKSIYDVRVKAMAGLLNAGNLQQRILADRGFGGLVREAMKASGLSRNEVYKLLTKLCRLGFSEVSLLPRFDLCGAPGVKRPCDPGTTQKPGRQKAGRKTTAEQIAMLNGNIILPAQPGMSTAWANAIIAADSTLPSPKLDMPERCNKILESMFVKKFRQIGNDLIPVTPELGGYPNRGQIIRVLESL